MSRVFTFDAGGSAEVSPYNKPESFLSRKYVIHNCRGRGPVGKYGDEC